MVGLSMGSCSVGGWGLYYKRVIFWEIDKIREICCMIIDSKL